MRKDLTQKATLVRAGSVLVTIALQLLIFAPHDPLGDFIVVPLA